MRALTNLSQIATGEGRSFLSGERQADVKVYENHSILIHNGSIAEITRAVPPGVNEIDCDGGVAVPGFVDPHTHIAFAGNRVQEFYLRINGASYLDILRSGHGIYRTIRDTVNADENRILTETISRVWSAVRRGTTTMEMKTGYGLDQRGEEKILSAIETIKNTGPINVVPTYLAHVVPQDVQENAYVEGIVETVKRNRRRISYTDVFCDAGAFSPEASRRFLEASISLGIPVRIHANEIDNIGCVKKTRGLPIVSYDHMIHFDDADLDIVKENGSSITLLPITVFALNEIYPDARRIIDRGIPVSIATDISPLNMNNDMIFAMHLAVRNNHMNAEEVLNAATINPAASLGLAERKGTIERGKDADLVVLSARSYDEIPYLYGLDIVSMTVSRGRILYTRGDHGITDTREP